MKRPIHLLALLLLISITPYAQNIKFMEDKSWKQVLDRAAKEKKIIFIDTYATWCGPCIYMDSMIFTDRSVADFYNSRFVNVKIDLDNYSEDIPPEVLEEVSSIPTFLFLDATGQFLHKHIGSLEASEFIELGRNTLDPENQYFTIKRQVAKGAIDPVSFHTWISNAAEIDDKKLPLAVRSYFQNTRFPLAEKEMLSVMLDYADSLSDYQLNYLHKEKARITVITDRTEANVSASLKRILVSTAYLRSNTGDSLNLQSFRAIIQLYPTMDPELETRKARIRDLFERGETERALNGVLALLQDKQVNPPAEELAALVADYAKQFVAAERSLELSAAIRNYKVPADEQDKAYYKTLAFVTLYAYMGLEGNALLHAKKLFTDKNVPETVTNAAKKVLAENEMHFEE